MTGQPTGPATVPTSDSGAAPNSLKHRARDPATVPTSDSGAAPNRLKHRARDLSPEAARRRDERGGAISLWVVLMVPVSAFAAVVAMAGPQRLAAESSVQEAADDLATYAVAWRDGHQDPDGPLLAFPTDCEAETDQQQTDIADLAGDIALLNPGDPIDTEKAELHRLLGEFKLPLPTPAATDEIELQHQYDTRLVARLKEWEDTCSQLLNALARDLGYLGVDFGSLRGSYSDSLSTSSLIVWECSVSSHTTKKDCEDAGETWSPTTATSMYHLPCRTAEETVVRDAVHVALVADWQDAGWAAAQVWPDGIPMAGESTGRLSQYDPNSSDTGCTNQLVMVDDQGRPVWSGTDPTPDSRKMVQSVRRSTLSG